MKRTAVLLLSFLFILSALLFTGCGSDDIDSGDDRAASIVIDMPALADKLLEEIPFQDQMSEVDPDVFYMLYDLTKDDADEAILITSTGATAEEIAVIHAASKDKVQTVHDAVTARVQTQRDGFEDYVPKELEKLEKPVMIEAGSYYILCISGDNEKAKDVVQQFIME